MNFKNDGYLNQAGCVYFQKFFPWSGHSMTTFGPHHKPFGKYREAAARRIGLPSRVEEGSKHYEVPYLLFCQNQFHRHLIVYFSKRNTDVQK